MRWSSYVIRITAEMEAHFGPTCKRLFGTTLAECNADEIAAVILETTKNPPVSLKP